MKGFSAVDQAREQGRVDDECAEEKRVTDFRGVAKYCQHRKHALRCHIFFILG